MEKLVRIGKTTFVTTAEEGIPIQEKDAFLYNSANNSKSPEWEVCVCKEVEEVEGAGTFYNGELHHIWCRKITRSTHPKRLLEIGAKMLPRLDADEIFAITKIPIQPLDAKETYKRALGIEYGYMSRSVTADQLALANAYYEQALEDHTKLIQMELVPSLIDACIEVFGGFETEAQKEALYLSMVKKIGVEKDWDYPGKEIETAL